MEIRKRIGRGCDLARRPASDSRRMWPSGLAASSISGGLATPDLRFRSDVILAIIGAGWLLDFIVGMADLGIGGNCGGGRFGKVKFLVAGGSQVV